MERKASDHSPGHQSTILENMVVQAFACGCHHDSTLYCLQNEDQQHETAKRNFDQTH